MNPMLFIVIGGVSVTTGIYFLIKVYFDVLIKNYHVLFHRDINYRLYEDDEAKESIKEAKRMYRNIGVLLVIVGAAPLIWGCIVKYGPRGNASIFSNNITEGIYKLDDEEGYFVQENSKTYDTIIVVSGKDIYINGNKVDSYEEFAEYIKSVDQVTKIYIKDNYSVASSFHYVESILCNNEKTSGYEISESGSE